MDVVLASASPRRLALLKQVGITASVHPQALRRRLAVRMLPMRWCCTTPWASAELWRLRWGTASPSLQPTLWW